ncbi:hypothetical protein CFN78_08855 [Amycolatopsis antarctica]|uniref:Uncharacterized protein n=1 Tax=Amycolatopsis antarctica TaxID=1854586 RepID=A0A263D824_9PSEU|nr:hypothetical protein [Amycolatopsis antarctica]OZM73626.1 hypothetical protein CFN78_08855 [Amycolatopsis antarctica]
MIGSPPGTISAEGDRDYVTELDVAIQYQIRDHPHRATPGLAWVGEGRTGACVILAKPWDLAADIVMAREACAEVYSSDGGTYSSESPGTVAASSSSLGERLVSLTR